MVNQRVMRVLLRLLGPKAFGRLEYALSPDKRESWGGPMNGQHGRLDLCRQLFDVFRPIAIVETGTFRGTTTKFFAQFGVPVFTVEFDPRYHAFALANTRADQGLIQITLGDSRSFLRELAGDPSTPKDRVFFYLDAHWSADLPLAEEITVIFSNWRRSVVMIDDFQVPGDSYGYDDYGPGIALDSDYLDAVGRSDLRKFYPAMPADQETGGRRGCIVLCNDRETQEMLTGLSLLRSL